MKTAIYHLYLKSGAVIGIEAAGVKITHDLEDEGRITSLEFENARDTLVFVDPRQVAAVATFGA